MKGSIKAGPRDLEFLRGQGCGCGRSFLKGGLGKGPGADTWLQLLVLCLLRIGKRERHFLSLKKLMQSFPEYKRITYLLENFENTEK